MARTDMPAGDLSSLSRAELEEALGRSMARAEEAEGAERAFLHAMSHELRTPLNAILGFTDVMLKGISGPLTDAQRRQLESVERSGRRLIQLVNDVLDLTKGLAGELELAIEEFDLGLVAAKITGEFRAEAEERGLGLALPALESARVLGDHRRVQQVLRHLLSNAIKFTDHGSVGVACRRVPGSEPPKARVTVSDTGIGIAPEHLKVIWQPFRQVDEGHARRYEGAGLGLSLGRLLMESMGGSIEVESEPGKGSRFHIELPLAERR